MGEIQDVVRAAKKRGGKSFDFAHFRPVNAAAYKAALAKRPLLGDPGAMGLRPLVVDASGGYYLAWPGGPIKGCVVYVGSGSERFVAASSQAELIAMMPYGSAVHDAMAYWFARLTDPGAAGAAPVLTPATLDARRTSRDAADGWIGAMAAAVTAAGVALEPDPMAKIEAANRAALVEWMAVCERRFETQQVAADLARPPRAYRASEGFQIGERIAHPTFGEGVVEARPEPGKMTVFFLSGRKVLAQAKDPPRPDVTLGKRR